MADLTPGKKSFIYIYYILDFPDMCMHKLQQPMKMDILRVNLNTRTMFTLSFDIKQWFQSIFFISYHYFVIYFLFIIIFIIVLVNYIYFLLFIIIISFVYYKFFYHCFLFFLFYLPDICMHKLQELYFLSLFFITVYLFKLSLGMHRYENFVR